MERLTYVKSSRRWDGGRHPTKYTSRHTFQEVVARLAAYEDAMPFERAQELAQADKDGRLVVLPYKIGDLVYRIAVRGKYLNRSVCAPYIKVVKITTENAHKYIDEIGKTVFLTREEADAALKKREEENNATN